jgi:predicted DNA-binding protein YlxM (UPF0122 family)
VIVLEKKYSMKEIAKQLNVSRGTIDQVIHNRGRISEETAKKVRDFLQKIEYTPKKVGRGLSKKFNKHVYIIYHVNKNDYFMEVFPSHPCTGAAASRSRWHTGRQQDRKYGRSRFDCRCGTALDGRGLAAKYRDPRQHLCG